jgi:hypothetical protein
MADRTDVALAEFTALRQEIDSRSTTQQNLFVLQLTSAGALFGFALSGPSRTLLLLIIPFSTYLLCTRSLVQITAIAVIGEYIRDELEPAIEGLAWERYWRQLPHPFPFARWAHPNLLLFAGVSSLALLWTMPSIIGHRHAVDAAGLAVVWLLGAVVTIYVAHLTWTSATKVFAPRPRA